MSLVIFLYGRIKITIDIIAATILGNCPDGVLSKKLDQQKLPKV
jgi:hypothetical protein